MLQQITFESLLRDLLTPIIEDAVNSALAKYLPAFTTTQQQTEPEIMDIDQASNFLGLSKATMYKKTAGGVIAHYKTGKKLFFKRSELMEWVTKVRVKPQYEIEQEANAYIMKRRKH